MVKCQGVYNEKKTDKPSPLVPKRFQPLLVPYILIKLNSRFTRFEIAVSNRAAKSCLDSIDCDECIWIISKIKAVVKGFSEALSKKSAKRHSPPLTPSLKTVGLDDPERSGTEYIPEAHVC